MLLARPATNKPMPVIKTMRQRRVCASKNFNGGGTVLTGHAVAPSGQLRSAPVRMLPRVCAPAQPLEVEVLRVAKEVPQLDEAAIGYMAQPKDRDVFTPALRAAGSHGVFGIELCQFEPRE
jgi:hypothetical protein